MFRHEFAAIGTAWVIQSSRPLLPELKTDIALCVEDFDHRYSRFRADSLVSSAARSAGRYVVGERSEPMFDLYRRLHRVTDGAVSPLVGGPLAELGYGPGYRLRPHTTTPEILVWDESVRLADGVIATDRPVTLDFGAAGKGYLVDLVSEILSRAGHSDFLVDAGGDLRQSGPVSARVGLENPFDPTQVIGVAELHGAALAGSASNRRRWAPELHHILDARTSRPVDDIVATWVVADSALLADGLATALFVCAPAVLATEFAFDYVRVAADGSADYSLEFPGELFR